MKFFKYLLFLLLIAIIGMAIYVAVQPNSFKVSESTTINAPKAVVFEAVADTSKVDWSSFWKATETLKTVSTDAEDSIQQNFTSDRIKTSQLNWNLESNADGSTTITRTLDADHLSFGTKIKTVLFGGMENEVANQFKNDFKTLNKTVTESMKAYTINVEGVKDYGGGFYLYKTISSTGSNLSNMMSKQFGEIVSFMETNGIKSNGIPFTIYIERNEDTGNVIMSNGIPVSENILITEDSTILCGFMERTKALKVTLKGNYSNLPEAWATARQYITDNHLETSEMSPFEMYVNNPANLPNPANWITEIYIPIIESEVL